MGKFKFVQSDTFLRQVKATAVDDSVIVITDCEFKHLLMKDWGELAGEKGNEALHDVLLGWGSCVDDAGNELEFSEEAVEGIINHAFIRNEVLEVYSKALSGFDRKNLSASQGLGSQNRPAPAKRASNKKKRQKRS